MSLLGQVTPYASLGYQRLVRIVDGNSNTILGSTKIIDFTDTSERTTIKISPINSGGVIYEYSIPDGHKGSVTFVREDSSIDKLQSDIETRIFTGQAPMLYSIYILTKNMNGSVSESVFSGCDLWVSDGGGAWSRDKEVNQKVDFSAQKWTFLS